LKIYIAAPYSMGDTETNVQVAIHYGDCVARRGHIPFIPHLNHLWHEVYPHPWEWWMNWCLEWLPDCDAVLRVPGESKGADREVNLAQNLGMDVYYSMEDIPDVI